MMALLTALTASALQFGDPAPPIVADQWLQGGPTATAGRVVVVEFFATWCGPCRSTVPHLSALQAASPDELVIIGVAADPGESPELLRRFISHTGMSYRAITDADGMTYAGFMEGMSIDGIPAAFLIDRSGRLVWQGHPEALDVPLAEALASPLPGEADDVPSPAEAEPAADDAGLLARLARWWSGLWR